MTDIFMLVMLVIVWCIAVWYRAALHWAAKHCMRNCIEPGFADCEARFIKTAMKQSLPWAKQPGPRFTNITMLGVAMQAGQTGTCRIKAGGMFLDLEGQFYLRINELPFNPQHCLARKTPAITVKINGHDMHYVKISDLLALHKDDMTQDVYDMLAQCQAEYDAEQAESLLQNVPEQGVA